jgi:hypothetical protein
MTAPMPDPYQRIENLVHNDLKAGRNAFDITDRAVSAVLDVAREIENANPGWVPAFQALAETLGYV